MNKSTVLKCFVILLIVLVVGWACFNILNKALKDLDTKVVTITDELGNVFKIKRSIQSFPDPDSIITIWCNEKVVFESINTQCNDLTNDIKNYFYKIEKEYHSGSVHAYLFPWGILYSFDDKKTFDGVGERDYVEGSLSTPALEEIYEALLK